jgi:hypothetical protein
MKRLLISLILAGSCLLSFSQIDIKSYLETGYEDRRVAIYKETPSYYFRKSMFTNLDISAEWKGIQVYTTISTYFNARSIVSYKPVQTEYLLGVQYTIKGITIDFNHLCSHSIDAVYFRDGWNKISIKVPLIK